MPRRRPPRVPSGPKSSLQTNFELLTYALFVDLHTLRYSLWKLTRSSRLPPRQLPILAVYARLVVYVADKGWIPKDLLGKGGAAIVGVLSMGESAVSMALTSSHGSTPVIPLLHRSSEMGRGKEGLDRSPNHHPRWCQNGTYASWVETDEELSIPTQASLASPSFSSPVDLGDISPESLSKESSPSKPAPIPLALVPSPEKPDIDASPPLRGLSSASSTARKTAEARSDELAGLLVGFAFALQ